MTAADKPRADLASLLDASLAAHRAGVRLHVSLHGDDALAALMTWGLQHGLAMEQSTGTGHHPRGEQRWTMVRAICGDDTIATAHSTPEVTEHRPVAPPSTCTATGGVLYGDDVRCALAAGHDGGHLSHQGGELRW